VPSYTLQQIAEKVRGRLEGDPGRRITGVQPLDAAGPGDISFLAHPKYRPAAESSRAGAFLVRGDGRVEGRDLVLVDSPYTALAATMEMFHPRRLPPPGISPQAVVAGDAVLGRDASIGPLAVVGEGCSVGERTVVMPGVVIGDQASIGADTILHPGVVVYPRTIIGARVVILAGAVIGSDGFGFGEEAGGRAKIPQVGIVRIDDDVEIGAGTTIDRATFGETVIGRGCRIDNLVQIGHNVVVGEGSVLVAQTGIAGSTHLGKSVIMAGRAAAAGHLRIGDGAVIGANSVVLADLEPGAFVLGVPAVPHREWKRAQAVWRRLPDLLRRVQRLEAVAETHRARSTPRGGGKPARRPRARRRAS
jgi:UDP-3-O-[3-hydroxymyristoyl] glucosamine N-acyltransferase